MSNMAAHSICIHDWLSDPLGLANNRLHGDDMTDCLTVAAVPAGSLAHKDTVLWGAVLDTNTIPQSILYQIFTLILSFGKLEIGSYNSCTDNNNNLHYFCKFQQNSSSVMSFFPSNKARYHFHHANSAPNTLLFNIPLKLFMIATCHST
jgi:hypothetical protein